MIATLFLLIFALISDAQHSNYKPLKTKLPIPLLGHITAIYNNNLFVFGGKNGNKFNDKFWKLPLSSFSLNMTNLDIINEPSNTDWIQISVKPPTYGSASNIGIGSNTFVCENQCSVLVNQYLYIFGSGSFALKQNNFINTIYRLDLSQDPPIFASENDLPITNLNNAKPFCVTAAMGKIYINTPFKTIQYDPMSIELQSIDIKYTPKYNFGCAPNFGEENIYLLGGNNDSYSYSIATNTNRYFQYSKDTSRNNIKCISLGLYSYNIECPGGLDMVNHSYPQNSIIWNTYNNSQTYVNLQIGVAQYGLELYQIHTDTNYNASIIFVIGGANDETGIEKAIDTIQYSVRYESTTHRPNQFIDASLIPITLKNIKMKQFREKAIKGIKRRLESYVDDKMDYYYDDDEQTLDDWIDNLSFDEAIYLYDLLNNEYDDDNDAVYFDEYDNYYYDEPIDNGNDKKKKTIAIASSQPPLKTDIEVVSKTWCKTSKKYKGDVCLGNNLLQSHGETIVSTTSKNNQNDGMFNAGAGYSRFFNHIKQKLFTKNKKYKYKGLAWEKKNSNGKCNKPPTDINDYVLRFAFGSHTRRLISPSKFVELSQRENIAININGNPFIPSSEPIPTPTDKQKRCLSLCGGGIKAAMMDYWVLRELEDKGKLTQIDCVSLISGGSWGFILWLFEDPKNKNSAYDNITHSIKDGGEWGLGNKFQTGKFGKWQFNEWINEIKTQILDMTTLKGKQTNFKGIIGQRLKYRKLENWTVYFVVESLQDNINGELKDYCWFKSDKNSDTFQCSKDMTEIPIPDEQTVINKAAGDKKLTLTLEHVLTYCSAGFSSKTALEQGVKMPTFPFEINHKQWFLTDSGGTFNEPVFPYIMDEQYKNHIIWNFDPVEEGSLFGINKLPQAMTNVGQKEYKLEFIGCEKGIYYMKFKNRIIKHCLLYGDTKGFQLTNEYPVMVGMFGAFVKRWNMNKLKFFTKEWKGYLQKSKILENKF
eukprot:525524_1